MNSLSKEFDMFLFDIMDVLMDFKKDKNGIFEKLYELIYNRIRAFMTRTHGELEILAPLIYQIYNSMTDFENTSKNFNIVFYE